MGDQRIVVSGVSRMYSPAVGVRGIDLTVARNEIHALVGLNGAGKTTLMRLLLGMLRPDRGRCEIDGHDVATAGPDVWARVGHVVDHALVYRDLDVHSNLVLAARLHGVPRRHVDRVVCEIVDELDLGRYRGVRAARLSHGNRQRVGLATALLHDPTTLVLDEPTNALDPAGVIALRETLLRRKARGVGVLVSSHHLDEVARVAGRITVVNHGRVIGTLDPAVVDIERAFFTLVHSDDQQAGAAR